MAVTVARRPRSARLVAVLAAVLLAAGCSGSPEEEGSSPAAQGTTAEEPAASDGDDSAGDDSAGGASDEGGKTAAVVPQESYEVTPAPEGFVPPEPCTGEGAFYAELGGEANPGLPERGGEPLTVSLESIEGDSAQLMAQVGDSPAREIGPITLGETVAVDLWTLSVTSVCADSEQVEFDLID